LTAAHCVWEIQATDMMIVFGEQQNLMAGNPDAYRLKRVIPFPLYRDKAGNYASDIALLEVTGSVEFSESVHPVCMDWTLDDITSHLSHDSVGMVMGMGLTEEDKFSNVVKATRLPVVANGKCLEDQDEDFRKYVTFTAFCAGWKNGTGVCNGDSGGGLVFPLGTGERWCLQGIVSLSPRRLSTSYCDTKKYTIFTKVGIYVKWIGHTLAKVHATHNFTTEGTYEPIL
jgi:secreted trypsin-like serine protease